MTIGDSPVPPAPGGAVAPPAEHGAPPPDVPGDGRASREPVAERHARLGHRVRLYLAALLFVLLVVAISLVSAANTAPVTVDWLVGSTSTSPVWLVVSASTAGWLLGIITGATFRFRTRRRRRPRGEAAPSGRG